MAYLSRSNDIELTDLDIPAPTTAVPLTQSPEPIDNVVALPKAKRKAADGQCFDYSGVSAVVAKEAEATAKRIRNRLQAHIIETGKELLVIKDGLGHGKFGKWLEFHFGWKERTAQNYMISATVFGPTPQVIDALPQSLVYKLAAKSTPVALRQSVVDAISRGEKPDLKQIIRKIAATKIVSRKSGDPSDSASAGGSQETSEISVQDDAIASREQVPAIEVPAIASLDSDAAQSTPVAQEQELLAQKVVGYIKKRFGDKFPTLRDAILNTDSAALRKALSEA